MWIKRSFTKSRQVDDEAALDSGAKAEREAENYLLERGLALKQRNYRCKLGEIDLIMLDGQTYVFVEVRYRKHLRFGSPAETIDASKQKKLLRAAQYFLQSEGLVDRVPCRFDVVSIAGQGESSRPTIDWIENAF